jgi:hypothetical protein
VRQSSIALLEEQGYYEKNPYFFTTIKQLEFAREAPLTPSWPGIAKEINAGIEQALLENLPALDALKAAEERARDQLE